MSQRLRSNLQLYDSLRSTTSVSDYLRRLQTIREHLTQQFSSVLLSDLPVTIIIHYGELGLKGRNRPWFERRLLRNIRLALRDLPIPALHRRHGRFLLVLDPDHPEIAATAIERLQRVFGIATLNIGLLLPQQLSILEAAAREFAVFTRDQTFAVRVKRSQKNFPLTSQQLESHLGAIIQRATESTVDLSNPAWTFAVELFNHSALCYSLQVPGARGLPSGSSGKAVALLSSGIDSPVAAWKLMKRGISVIFVHFHSVPYTSPASQHNVKKIVQYLTRWQLRSRLYLVGIAELQKQIMLHIPSPYRILFYRRTMYQLAEAIAKKEEAKALITGESVGQVASQTLENLMAVNEVVSLPVLRPLSGDDKEEIISLARQLGTYELSLLPDEDCCTLFTPKNVITRARLEEVHTFAHHLSLEPLLDAALDTANIIDFRYPEASAPYSSG